MLGSFGGTFRNGKFSGVCQRFGPDQQNPPGFKLADRFHRFRNQLVPIFRVIGHGFVHQLVGDPVHRVLVQVAGNPGPQPDEVVLRHRVRPQRDLAALVRHVEMVGFQNMEVHHSPQVVLRAPIEAASEISKRFLGRLAIRQPHFGFVNGDAHMVIADAGNERDVLLGDEGVLGRPAKVLRQPVAEIDAPFQLKARGRGGFLPVRRGCGSGRAN